MRMSEIELKFKIDFQQIFLNQNTIMRKRSLIFSAYIEFKFEGVSLGHNGIGQIFAFRWQFINISSWSVLKYIKINKSRVKFHIQHFNVDDCDMHAFLFVANCHG